jgi:hypothetical protein
MRLQSILGSSRKPQSISKIKGVVEDLKGLETEWLKSWTSPLPPAPQVTEAIKRVSIWWALVLGGWSLDYPFLELKSCTSLAYALYGIYEKLKPDFHS